MRILRHPALSRSYEVLKGNGRANLGITTARRVSPVHSAYFFKRALASAGANSSNNGSEANFKAENAKIPSEAAAIGRNGSNGGKKAKKPWGALKWAMFGGLSWLTIYLLDAAINDDLDLVADKFRTRLSPEEMNKRPHVVILGGGWAALSMLRKLHTDHYRVTIISPRNYFLFTPLLPGTTTGTLSPRSVVEPIRQFCRRSDAAEADFIEAECTRIDPKNSMIYCSDKSEIKGEVSDFAMKYDHLIVAVGAQSATFGIPGVEKHAVFMKDVHHTTEIRDRILDCMESACVPGQTKEEIERLLHFVVVGGGPSGVEYAAELNDFLVNDMAKGYPEHADKVKITLIEAMPHILTMFDKNLIDYTESYFKKSNIDVKTNSFVKNVGEKSLQIATKDGQIQDIPFGVLVWVTGNTTHKLISHLIQEIGETDQPNRRALMIDEHLRVKGTDNIWSMGDCSFMKLPATAQVASQQGRYLGRLFNSLADDFYSFEQGEISRDDMERKIESAKKFQYFHFGSFAYIGSSEAIAQVSMDEKGEKKLTSAGAMTFFLWRSVYFSKLLSYKNRFLVLTDWLKTMFFGRDISRA